MLLSISICKALCQFKRLAAAAPRPFPSLAQEHRVWVKTVELQAITRSADLPRETRKYFAPPGIIVVILCYDRHDHPPIKDDPPSQHDHLMQQSRGGTLSMSGVGLGQWGGIERLFIPTNVYECVWFHILNGQTREPRWHLLLRLRAIDRFSLDHPTVYAIHNRHLIASGHSDGLDGRLSTW